MALTIEQAAVQHRAVALLRLQWMLDAWKLEVGMVEVVPREDRPVARRLRRGDSVSDDRIPPARFLPLFDGTGLLVRDVIRDG